MIESILHIPPEVLADFCKRWKIARLEVFGSALREDFGPESDVDLLVTFEPDAHPTLVSFVDMQHELERMPGRSVDLLTRRSVEKHHNPWTRHLILSSARKLYPAA